MNEMGWLTSRIPRAMLTALDPSALAGEIDRELRLFACSCVRHVSHLLEDVRSREAVEVAERYAEGMATAEEMDAASQAASTAAYDAYYASGLDPGDPRTKVPESRRGGAGLILGARLYEAASAASWASTREFGRPDNPVIYRRSARIAAGTAAASASNALAGVAELKAREESTEVGRFYEDPWQADRLRCIFGNPFRAPKVDPAWITPGVVALARGIHDGRAFDRTEALGQALHDARCDEPAILAHCRPPGNHDRGCWVVDLLLGKRRGKALG